MKFISTRSAHDAPLSGSEAIIQGLCSDGGLFVPSEFAHVTMNEIMELENFEYADRAAWVLSKYLDEFSHESLIDIMKASAERFGHDGDGLQGEVCPVVKLDDSLYIMELWHGPTHAFKDVALTVLPRLLVESKKMHGGGRTLILTATSGDTGKAALEGFRDIEGIDVIVFYPTDGVSAMQKLQMQTSSGSNVSVVAIDGNFDDAQNAVKSIFSDNEAKKKIAEFGYSLSSANSINIGRLLPQITYYFSAYSDLAAYGDIQYGDEVNFCVPTGNFGNILAGYYAKKMGLPIGKLICASNSNNVLSDFLDSGKYDINRTFFKTISPSMDILISSNLERLIFELSARDAEKTMQRMAQLKSGGKYSVSDEELQALKKDFYGDSASDEETNAVISNFFEEHGYILDPHTAVAVAAYCEYNAETCDERPTVIVSTANAHKFASSVLSALGIKPHSEQSKNLNRLENETALPVPKSLQELSSMPIIHKSVINRKDALNAVLEYCKNKKGEK